jgi:hypothetical protein
MQKVYSLLRNNQQTGPYSLDEILQLNLKPFDLVWVEGRSAAWRYPSEIETLKPYVAEVPRPQTPFEPVSTADMEKNIEDKAREPKIDLPKKVFVSMPPKAPQVPSQIYQGPREHLASHDQYLPKPEQQTPFKEAIEEKNLHTNYVRPLDEVEEDYTKWVYQKKTTKKSGLAKKDLAIAAVALGVIVAGYFILSKPGIVQAGPSTEPAKALVMPEQPIEKVTDENGKETKEQTREEKRVEKTAKLITPSSREKPKSGLPLPSTAGKEMEGTVPVNENVQDKLPVETAPPKPEPKQETAKKEKKKLGEVIKGIFSKKDKKETAQKEEPVLEEPKPANNRQATRRAENETENGEESGSGAVLADMIDISSNAPANWMMGISGLKVTVRNRNNVVIKTAAVQVLYLDENNSVLDKKTVYFNNIPAKGKLTLPAPDHKFADHVDFKLAAVTAKENDYARN